MADYRKLVPFILRWEGGWTDDKDDKGGKTNRGITINTYKALSRKLLHQEPTMANFRQLTKAQAALFVKHFWDKSTANNQVRSQKIAEAITTWRWGSGSYGLKEFQRLLNRKYHANLKVDGVIGRNTVAKVNAINPDHLFNDMLQARKAFFERLAQRDPSQTKFLKGWINRLVSFGKTHQTVLKNTAKYGLPIALIGMASFFLS